MSIDAAAAARPGFLAVAPQFTVRDVSAAAAYYCDVLGFENREDCHGLRLAFGEDPGRPVGPPPPTG